MKYEIRIHDKLVATVHQSDYLIDIIKATGAKISDVVKIDAQPAAAQSEDKPAPVDEFPHMKFGLPKYYAVMIDDESREIWRSEGIDRHNKIHNEAVHGELNFYGFDGKANYSNDLNSFKGCVALLSVFAFINFTDDHFKGQK